MDTRDRNRVYIGHLPDDISAEELTTELSRFGRVRDVDIKYGRTRNGTAYAFAEFADSDGAEKAVAESGGLLLSGVRVKVEFTGGVKRYRSYNDSYQRQGGDPRCQSNNGPMNSNSTYPQRSENKVIVTGLPKNTSWQDLKDHMRKAGAVGFAVVYDKGVGVVEYRDRESLQEAVSLLNNSTIMTHVDMAGVVNVYLPEDYPAAIPTGNGPPRRRSLTPPHYRRSVSPRRSAPGGYWDDHGSNYGPVRNSFYRDSTPPRRPSSPYSAPRGRSNERYFPNDRQNDYPPSSNPDRRVPRHNEEDAR